MVQLQLLPTALSDLFVQATISGYLTVADRYGLLAALLDEKLAPEDQAVIDRLLRAVCKGRVALVNQLSVVS